MRDQRQNEQIGGPAHDRHRHTPRRIGPGAGAQEGRDDPASDQGHQKCQAKDRGHTVARQRPDGDQSQKQRGQRHRQPSPGPRGDDRKAQGQEVLN